MRESLMGNPEPGVDTPQDFDPIGAIESLPEPGDESSSELDRAEAMENLPEPGVDFPSDFDRSEEPSGSSRYFRWGTYSLGVLILGMVFYVVIAENWTIAKKLNPGIDDLVESLQQGGLKVGDVNVLPDRSGARWAKQVVLDGHPIYLYQFAINTDKQQKQLLDEITKTGTIKVNGDDVLAKVHGPFVLTHWQDAPYRDELVRIYLAFGGYGSRTEMQQRAAADRASSGGDESQNDSGNPHTEPAENLSAGESD
jgi:hypothetical protein